jgi:CheY-like chemotaxis protein
MATFMAITGYGQERDQRQSAEAGFDAHLVKPVTVETLKAALRQVGVVAGDG